MTTESMASLHKHKRPSMPITSEEHSERHLRASQLRNLTASIVSSSTDAKNLHALMEVTTATKKFKNALKRSLKRHKKAEKEGNIQYKL